ncbi:MAG TPA: ABC transporter permease, partial [Thermoanaerobaculia bacterium]|nr:ABC transporter permease [Thermoanaerobaculia bacterium]
MTQDLRFALRSLRKAPAFTLTVVLTLALAVGATTAVYSAVHGILLSPLPFPESQELVTVWEDQSARGGPDNEWTGRSNFDDWRTRSRAFSSLAALVGFAGDLGEVDRPERLFGGRVSHEYFSTLGIEPAIGRDFRVEEEQPGNELVVILSHELWQRRFAGDPGILGSTVRLSDKLYEVIGVLPPGFDAPMQPGAEIFAPFVFPPDLDDRGNLYVRVIGRRAPGVSLAAARADMDRVGREVAAAHPVDYGDVGVTLQPLRDTLVVNAKTPLQVLFGAVVLVLLIACANVANLLLVRATVREEELAVRTALGAPRGRLVRSLLVEGMLLAAAGGGAGLFLAAWGVELLRNLAPAGTPRADAIALDGGVVLFAVVVTFVTGILFGLVPAWSASRPRLRKVLGGDGRGGAASGRGSGLRRGLVVAEIAVGLALLAGAGLLLRSLDELGRVDVGVETAGVAVGSVILPQAAYPESTQIRDFFDRLLAELDADPAVASAGVVDVLPLSGSQSDVSFVLQGETVQEGREPASDL